MPRKRPKVGDIVELPANSQLAYFQFTHQHSMYGALIRVFEGLYDQRPENPSALANLPVQFTTFFPLGAACNRGIVEIVVNADVVEGNRNFPIFKTRIVGPNKSFGPWHLWDGEREWRKDDLSDEELELPIRGVVNDTLLVSWIQSGHTDSDYIK